MLAIDTSALVAIMLGEPNALALRQRIAAELPGHRAMSVVSYLETGAVIAGRRTGDPPSSKRRTRLQAQPHSQPKPHVGA